MTKKIKNIDEKVIVTPSDIKLPEHVKNGYKPFFFCPKCDSSLIVMSERYTKNNLANSIESSGEGWEKIVLECDNCKYVDLINKFLKGLYDDVIDSQIKPLRKKNPYYTPYKPYWRPKIYMQSNMPTSTLKKYQSTTSGNSFLKKYRTKPQNKSGCIKI